MRRPAGEDADALFVDCIDRNAPDRRFRGSFLMRSSVSAEPSQCGQDKAAFVVEHPFELVVRVDPRNHTDSRNFERLYHRYFAESRPSKPFDGIFQPLLRNGLLFRAYRGEPVRSYRPAKSRRPHRQANGYAFQLVFREFETRCGHCPASSILTLIPRFLQFGGNLVRSRAQISAPAASGAFVNRDHHDLYRSQLRRQHEPVIVGVRHDQGPHQTGRNAPRGRPHIIELTLLIDVNCTSNAFAKFCPRKCDVPLCSAFPSCISASIVSVSSAPGETFAGRSCAPRSPAAPSTFRQIPCRRRSFFSASARSASSRVSCAVCPSCHRNSAVRRNRRVRISQRTTLAHWLQRIGRSRYD